MDIETKKTKKHNEETIDINEDDGDYALDNALAAEMIEAGVLYGHKKSKTHPKMKPFIVANRHEMEILDPVSVSDSLEKAVKAMKKTLEAGGKILFVGTTPQSVESIKNIAKSLSCPYIVTRWLGGTLTNFKVIRERIEHYLKLQRDKEQGNLGKYTKKEQVDFNKEINRLSKFFSGITEMNQKPNMIFVVDIKNHNIVVAEASKAGIPIVAIVDSNDNPDKVDYPIIANDHIKSSIVWVIDKIKGELVKGAKKAEETKENTEKAETASSA